MKAIFEVRSLSHLSENHVHVDDISLSLLPTLCFQKLLLSRNRFPNIHYIGIDRPDAVRLYSYSESSFPLFLNNTDPIFFWHTKGDCLHIVTGAGIIEGWTHCIL